MKLDNFFKSLKKKSSPNQTESKKNSPASSLVNRSSRVYNSFEDLPFVADEILFMSRPDDSNVLFMDDNERENFLYIRGAQKGQTTPAVILLISDICNLDIYRAKILALKNRVKSEYKCPTYTYTVSQNVILEALQKISSDFGSSNYAEEELIRKFDTQLAFAIESKVTDIHFRIGKATAKVEYRLHGEIQYYNNFNTNLCLSMIRALYNAKGAEGQKDQQFNPKTRQQTIVERIIHGRKYRLRFASAPVESNDLTLSKDGNTEEFIVSLRILSTDKSAIPALAQLGYNHNQIDIFNESLLLKDGAVIFAGTTGSGKSTSLASIIYNLIRLSAGKSRILSVESPVEYIIEGVNQLIVHESASMTDDDIAREYESALKTLMRLDPDVMMCNEIRNFNTGDFFQKGVQSGHMMLTTVHAQSAFQITERLTAIGMDRDVIITTDFAKLLVYQRLVATLCPYCSLDFDKYSELETDRKQILEKAINKVAQNYHLTDEDLKKIKFRNPRGCEHCSNLGISGRSVIAEVVSPSHDIIEFLAKREPDKARRYWRENHVSTTIEEHGLQKMLKGEVCPWSLYTSVGPFHIDLDYDYLPESYYTRTRLIEE